MKISFNPVELAARSSARALGDTTQIRPSDLSYGQLLALGYSKETAEEVHSRKSNWRLRTVIAELREVRADAASDGLIRDDRTGAWVVSPKSTGYALGAYSAKVGRAESSERARRYLAHLEWHLRYLLTQRGRLRRKRGMQSTLDEFLARVRAAEVAALEVEASAEKVEMGEQLIIPGSETKQPSGSPLRHTSDSYEHGTPIWLADLVHEVLAGIDLDPASSEEWNRNIGAARIYTREQDGRNQPWSGTVFLNPPGGLIDRDGRQVLRASKKRGKGCTETGACGIPAPHKHHGVQSSGVAWWGQLAANVRSGCVPAACFLGFTLELLQATQQDGDGGALSGMTCVFAKRIDYLGADGKPQGEPPHGSFLTLLTRADTSYARMFGALFAPHGAIVTRWSR